VALAQHAMRLRDRLDPVLAPGGREHLGIAAVAGQKRPDRAHAGRGERLADRPDLVGRAGQAVQTQRCVAAVSEVERACVERGRRGHAHRRAASSASRTTSRSGTSCARAARTQSSTSAENVSRPSGSCTTFTAIFP